MPFLARERVPLDISLGGMRLYSDHKLRVGALLNLEIHSQEFPPVCCTTEIVRVEATGRGAPARFAIGLRFVDLGVIALKVLLHLLGRDHKWAP